MDNYVTENELQMVAKNCSQFSPIASVTATMSTLNEVSCSICKNWNGQRCTINAYDNVANNLDFGYTEE